MGFNWFKKLLEAELLRKDGGGFWLGPEVRGAICDTRGDLKADAFQVYYWKLFIVLRKKLNIN